MPQAKKQAERLLVQLETNKRKHWPNLWPSTEYTMNQFNNAKQTSRNAKQNRGQQEIYAETRPIYQTTDFPPRHDTR